ncbi:hypothetical protein KJ611_04905 [Patescibacteria group bacterium]|nr:hypothetical protein [Patescibacteria group bacterium]
MQKKTKADVVFDEVYDLLTGENIDEERSKKVANELIKYLRKEKNRLNSKDLGKFFEKLLAKNSIDGDEVGEIMEHFSMMGKMCIDGYNKCFSDLDSDGTLISLSNKEIDEDIKDDEEEFSEQEMKIFTLLNEARHHRNVSCNDKKAIKICDEILEIDENNRDEMLIKAGALGFIGKNKYSLNLINLIIDKWPNQWEAYYLLGLHLFNKNERKAMQAFKKSLEFEERFDNLVSVAQLAYFMGKHNYQEYLDKAEKLDSQRFKNFMKTCWTYDLN